MNQGNNDKEQNGKWLAIYYRKKLRSKLLKKHSGQMILMRSRRSWSIFDPEDIAKVFEGTHWLWWDQYGCYVDTIGAEEFI